MSELVRESGRTTEEDLAWLHAVLSDLQLLADLAFADMVLWAPTIDGKFVAVAQSRPSSAATLFYRDFVGQPIKPDWQHLVTRAFEGGRIVDSSAPDWFEETPTRVRAIPVFRRTSPSAAVQQTIGPIAVLTRHTNLSEARMPSRQEITFNECANELFGMIAEGSFPQLQAPANPGVARPAHPMVSSASMSMAS